MRQSNDVFSAMKSPCDISSGKYKRAAVHGLTAVEGMSFSTEEGRS